MGSVTGTQKISTSKSIFSGMCMVVAFHQKVYHHKTREVANRDQGKVQHIPRQRKNIYYMVCKHRDQGKIFNGIASHKFVSCLCAFCTHAFSPILHYIFPVRVQLYYTYLQCTVQSHSIRIIGIPYFPNFSENRKATIPRQKYQNTSCLAAYSTTYSGSVPRRSAESCFHYRSTTVCWHPLYSA